VLDVAYPGFKDSRENGKNHVRVSPSLDGNKNISLPAILDKGSDPKQDFLKVTSNTLNDQNKKLKDLGKDFFVHVQYQRQSQKDKESTKIDLIPTLDKDISGPGKIAFTWTAPQAISPKVLNATIAFNAEGQTSNEIVVFVPINNLDALYAKNPGLKDAIESNNPSKKPKIIFKDPSGSMIGDKRFNFVIKDDPPNKKFTVTRNELNTHRKWLVQIHQEKSPVTVSLEYTGPDGNKKSIDTQKRDEAKPGLLTVTQAAAVKHKAVLGTSEVAFKGEVTDDKIELVFDVSKKGEIQFAYDGFIDAIRIGKVSLVFIDSLGRPREDTPEMDLSYSENHQHMTFTVTSSELNNKLPKHKDLFPTDKGLPLGIKYLFSGKTYVIKTQSPDGKSQGNLKVIFSDS